MQPQDCGLPADVLAAIRQTLARFASVEQALLYGSRAKGNYRPGSDIDLTLIGGQLSHRDLLDIDLALDDLLLPWKIDLSLHADIDNPELLAHIGRVGKPLYQRSAE